MSAIVARTYVIAKKGGLDRSVLNNTQKQTQTNSKNLSDSFLFFCTQILSKYTYPYREIIYNLPKNTFVEHIFYNKPKSLIFNSIYFNVK